MSATRSLARCSLDVAPPAAPVICPSWAFNCPSTAAVRSRLARSFSWMRAAALVRRSFAIVSSEAVIFANSSASCLYWG